MTLPGYFDGGGPASYEEMEDHTTSLLIGFWIAVALAFLCGCCIWNTQWQDSEPVTVTATPRVLTAVAVPMELGVEYFFFF